MLENPFNTKLDSLFLLFCNGVMVGDQTIKVLLLKKCWSNLSEKFRKTLVFGIVIGTLFMFFPLMDYIIFNYFRDSI